MSLNRSTNGRLLFMPDVAPYQYLREDPPGDAEKKMLEKYERSHYVYENKQISYKMPGKKSDIYV